ncbi:MAG TPA: YceD family protein [Chthoniobacterales bacterium]|nr:YceD family protein [Chthoniobacterales bacterium]
MKIHLRQIPAEGIHLEGDEDCPIEELATENIRCVGPLHYSLDVGITGNSLWANGTLRQPVELQCVSCLEKFTYVIEVPAFAVHTELAGPETVDLSPFIREDILLNLPAHPHCDRDGRRVCKAPHADAATHEDERKPDWSALDKLKLKKG